MSNGLGAFVKERRAYLQMSQTALAQAAGLAKSYLSQIEAGKIAFPNADVRRRLAQALLVTHMDLLVAAGEITVAELGGESGLPQPQYGAPPDDLRSLFERVEWVEPRITWVKEILQGFLRIEGNQ